MRSAFAFQRLNILQRRMRNEQNVPPLLTCREVLEFATVEGARCANLDSKIGTLSPGKDADIVVLKADRLDLWPVNNAFGTVVNLMNPSHVESVFIAGKVKKWRGTLVGVDMARVMRLASEAHDGLLRRTGLPGCACGLRFTRGSVPGSPQANRARARRWRRNSAVGWCGRRTGRSRGRSSD